MLNNNDMKIEPSKEDLSNLIDDVIARATRERHEIRKVDENLQTIIDHGRVTKPLVAFFDQNEISNQYPYWIDAYDQLGSISPVSGSLLSTTDYIAGTASESSASVIRFVSPIHAQLSDNDVFLDVWKNYTAVVTNESVFEKIRNLLCKLHLDNAPIGKLSPLTLFDTAVNAYNSPVSDDSPAISSLLPLRESISTSIEILLRFRPKQEKTGSSDKEKIISIGKQLKKDITSSAMVSKWAEEWHKINDEDLSDSKKAHISRDEWTMRLFRTANFYYGFLSGLDPSKFRKTY